MMSLTEKTEFHFLHFPIFGCCPCTAAALTHIFVRRCGNLSYFLPAAWSKFFANNCSKMLKSKRSSSSFSPEIRKPVFLAEVVPDLQNNSHLDVKAISAAWLPVRRKSKCFLFFFSVPSWHFLTSFLFWGIIHTYLQTHTHPDTHTCATICFACKKCKKWSRWLQISRMKVKRITNFPRSIAWMRKSADSSSPSSPSQPIFLIHGICLKEGFCSLPSQSTTINTSRGQE